jgi:L-lactate dehydrogenase complex protein LldG
MSSRDDIMAAIRSHVPKLERPEPSVPLFDDDAPANLLDAFGRQLERMGGALMRPDPTDPLAPVRAAPRWSARTRRRSPETNLSHRA